MRAFESIGRFGLIFVAVVVLVVGLAACGDDHASLHVVLVSDYAPGAEVTKAQTELRRGGAADAMQQRVLARADRTLRAGDSLARGLTIASLDGLADGTYTATVTLLSRTGDRVAGRPVTFEVRGESLSITTHITVSCATVQCPAAGSPGLTACFAGTCVDPRCTPETPEHCPVGAVCTGDDACALDSPCAAGVCSSGACVAESIAGRCGESEYCARENGCAPIDGPVLPGGPDERCGTICLLPDAPCEYGYYACTTTPERGTEAVCTSFLRRPVGAPCGEGRACDEAGECARVVVADDAGMDANVEVDAALDAAVDAELPSPCTSDNGGCDALTSCEVVDGEVVCGACPSGYTGDGRSGCADINECIARACGTTATCTNTVGSFVCGCAVGYVAEDGACADVDECESAGACADGRTCANEAGGYACEAQRIVDVFVAYKNVCVRYEDGGTRCRVLDRSGVHAAPSAQYEPWPSPASRFFGLSRRYSTPTGTRSALQVCAQLEDGSFACDAADPTGHLCEMWPGGCDDTSGGTARIDAFEDARAFGFGDVGAWSNDTFCYVDTEGRLSCWGENYYGLLGRPYASLARSETPLEIPLADDVTSLAKAHAFVCAALADGSAWCWGANYFGELGLGHFASITTPSRVSIDGDVEQVAAGYWHTCVRLDDGRVQCWGDNSYGQLGVGDEIERALPVAVALPRPAMELHLAAYTSCALFDDGRVFCWGGNDNGLLGTGDTEPSNVPVEVVLERPATQISVSTHAACALLDDGRVRCWGDVVPVMAYSGADPVLRGPVDIGLERRTVDDIFYVIDPTSWITDSRSPGTGYQWYCVRYRDGETLCGDDIRSPSGLRSFDFVSVESNARRGGFGTSTCMRRRDGTLACVGENYNGMLGTGDRIDRSEPTPVELGGAALDIAMGSEHTCVLRDDHDVFCFGLNDDGQLGIDGLGDRLASSERVELARPALEIEAIYDSTCALVNSGEVVCWGGRYGSRRDEPGTDNFGKVLLEAEATALVSATDHYCALLVDGRVQCWGSNHYGQLGVPAMDTGRVLASPLSFDHPALDIAGNERMTCAVLEGGSVVCWGQSPTSVTTNHVPTVVEGLPENIVRLSVGESLLCAIDTSGSAWCWGYDFTTLIASPTRVVW